MRGPADSSNAAPGQPPNQSTVLLLLGTIADTTWRMFVPIVGMLLLGVWIDKSFGTLPFAMIILTVVGIGIAALLVKQQLKSVNKK